MVGLGYEGLGAAFDVLNEHGLSISEHALRGVASYKPGNATGTRCANDLTAYLAGAFSTVASVREALPALAVLFAGPGDVSSPGSQWAIADGSGESIVVDYTDGRLQVFDNSGVGVMTNDPEWPWQVRNLDNYVGLSAGWPDGGRNISVVTPYGEVPTPPSHGQNLLGLPGDLSPPSRFVRAFFLRGYALRARPPASLDDALALASGLQNTNFIVTGANARADGERGFDYTQWTTLKVPSRGLYYYRTYEASQWRKIDLARLDFSAAATSRPSGAFAAVDVTSELGG